MKHNMEQAIVASSHTFSKRLFDERCMQLEEQSEKHERTHRRQMVLHMFTQFQKFYLTLQTILNSWECQG